jgi:hypothetical protein
MNEIKESDWKIFKSIKQEALDAFCNERLQEYEAIINDGSRTAHERYLDLFDLSRTRDKEMALLFDGHSRSKAFLQLLAIRRWGLANRTLVDKLSEDLRTATDPARFGG